MAIAMPSSSGLPFLLRPLREPDHASDTGKSVLGGEGVEKVEAQWTSQWNFIS